MHTGQDLDVSDTLDENGGGNDRNYVKQEDMMSMLTNLRRLWLDKKPHIKSYYKARKLYEEITTAMVDYHHSGKFELKIDKDYPLPAAASDSAVLAGISLDLDSREDPQAFYELIIFKFAPNMSCITEEFIKKSWYRKPEKIELLQSMLDSRMGLFEIMGTDIEEGYAYLKEVFTGIEYRLTDIGMSGNQKNEDIYIYTRIISYQDICFGTGMNLIFYKNDQFIDNHIQRHKTDYEPEREFQRFIQLYQHYIANPNKLGSYNPLEK
jgi:hypothetical protein